MQILENRIYTPFRIRGSYNATTKYNVGDVVRATVSGESRAWILMVDAPAGTAPRANSAYWAIFSNTLMTNRGAQGLPAPARQTRYVASDGTTRTNYVEGDTYEEISDDGGATWTRRRIKGDKGDTGNTGGTPRDGRDGTNAPNVIWQYAAQPEDENDPLVWRDDYVQGDVWKRWSNDNGSTWGVAERILGRDGRDGFDLERQYSTSDEGPWEVTDSGQAWVRERVGNIDAFGPPYRRHSSGGAGDLSSYRTETQIIALIRARSSRITHGTAFPVSPEPNQYFVFSGNVSSGLSWFGIDGTTAKTSAVLGAVAQWQTDKWVQQPFYFAIEGGATADQTEAEIRALISLTLASQNAAYTDAVKQGNDLVLTRRGGGTTTIALPSGSGMGGGNPVSGVAFVANSQQLTITLTDGTTFNVDLSSLEDDGNILEDDQVSFTVESQANLVPHTVMRLTPRPAITSHSTDKIWGFIAPANSVNRPGVRINSVASEILFRSDGSNMQDNDIRAGQFVTIRYHSGGGYRALNVHPPVSYVTSAQLNALADRVTTAENDIDAAEADIAEQTQRTEADEARIRRLETKTKEMEAITTISWTDTNDVTEAGIAIITRNSRVQEADLTPLTYTSAITLTSADVHGVFIVLRVATGTDISKYRVNNTHPTETGHKGTQYAPFDASGFYEFYNNVGGFDYYIHSGVFYATENGVLTLQETVATVHTKYDGDLETQRVEAALGDKVLRIRNLDVRPSFIDEFQIGPNYSVRLYLVSNAVPSASKVRLVFNGSEGTYRSYTPSSEDEINVGITLNQSQIDALETTIAIAERVTYEVQFANSSNEIQYRVKGSLTVGQSYLPAQATNAEIDEENPTTVIRSFSIPNILRIANRAIGAISQRLLPASGNVGETIRRLADGSYQSIPFPHTGVLGHDLELTDFIDHYAVTEYDAARYNANDIGYQQVMFNHADTSMATALKFIPDTVDVPLFNALAEDTVFKIYDFINHGGRYYPRERWSATIDTITAPTSFTSSTRSERVATISFDTTQPITRVDFAEFLSVRFRGAGLLAGRILPVVTAADNGKTLQVVDGVWTDVAASAAGKPQLVEQHRVNLTGNNLNWQDTGYDIVAGKILYCVMFDPPGNVHSDHADDVIYPSQFIRTDDFSQLTPKVAGSAFDDKVGYLVGHRDAYHLGRSASGDLLFSRQARPDDARPFVIYHYE